jgi:cytochrome b subunit of formate dehydrogenase
MSDNVKVDKEMEALEREVEAALTGETTGLDGPDADRIRKRVRERIRREVEREKRALSEAERRKETERRREELQKAKALPEGETFLRFNRNFRFQHMVMFTSVIILIITGMPIKFPDFILSRLVIKLWGGIQNSTMVHRIGAVMLIYFMVHHLLYTIFSRDGRRDFVLLLPRPKDLRDAIQNLRHFLGKSPEKPRFGRFSYIEKFDYWAVYWGCVVMIGSGAALWGAEGVVLKYLPKYMLDVAQVMHSDEALLATLAIVIWHFYNVHFNPDRFPGTLLWWHGRLSEHEMKEEHPLEYEEIMAKRASAEAEAEKAVGGWRQSINEMVRKRWNLFYEYRYGRPLLAFGGVVLMVLILVSAWHLFNLATKGKGREFLRSMSATLKGGTEIPDKGADEKALAPGVVDIDAVRARASAFHGSPPRAMPLRKPVACSPCHGGLTHSKNRDVRAMLNMHSDFIACAVCHLRRQDLDPADRPSWRVDWYDDATGGRIASFKPKTGVYNFEMAPSVIKDGKRVRIDWQIDPELASRERARWASQPLRSTAIAQAARKAHGGISKVSITCRECHRRESPYLDLAGLGYPKNWVDELTGPKVTSMLSGYSTFHIPRMFSPEAIRQEREMMLRDRKGRGK